jgi:uncharacterized protein (DUF433 family)
MAITRDEGVLGGEPRIEGTRVGVRHVAEKVIEGGLTPAYVSDQLDISLSEVYEALSYYYENTQEIREARRKNAEGFEDASDESLKPKETA